jgi:hypothetical protein
MVETTSSNVNMPLSERLSLKILALFLGTFLLAFFAFWAYGVVESYQEARAAEANIDMRPKTIVIDPRIQTELAQVIAFDSAAASPDVRDPFNDRTGISGLRAGTGAGSAGWSCDHKRRRFRQRGGNYRRWFRRLRPEYCHRSCRADTDCP